MIDLPDKEKHCVILMMTLMLFYQINQNYYNILSDKTLLLRMESRETIKPRGERLCKGMRMILLCLGCYEMW